MNAGQEALCRVLPLNMRRRKLNTT